MLWTLLNTGRSTAFGINDSGQIVGQADIDALGHESHATLFSGTGAGNLDLGILGGGCCSKAIAINNSGLIVGNFTTGSDSHGFLYSGGTMSDLNDLIVAGSGAFNIQFAEPSGRVINDWGQIAAFGNVAGLRALLLNPVTPFTTTSNGGTARNIKLIGGMGYELFIATTNPGNLGTTAALLDGTAGSSGAGTYGRNRDVNFAFSPGNSALLASDILTLTGTEGDLFVLQLTYDEALAVNLFGSEENVRLGWLDGSDWVLAVSGNSGGTPFFAGMGAYDPATNFVLGAYGVDTVNNHVWAVLDHNSSFAVIGVPEPTTCWLSLLGMVTMAARRTISEPK